MTAAPMSFSWYSSDKAAAQSERMDDTLDDTGSDHSPEDAHDYPIEVPSMDPKLPDSCQSSLFRWRSVLCGALGWIIALLLLGLLVQARHESNQPIATQFHDAVDGAPNPLATRPPDYDIDSDFVVRINAGSSQSYTDVLGRTWMGDAPPGIVIPWTHALPFVHPTNASHIVLTLQGDSSVCTICAPHDPTPGVTLPFGTWASKALICTARNAPLPHDGCVRNPRAARVAPSGRWVPCRLVLCEIFFHATRTRLFDVWMEDPSVGTQLDLVAVGGTWRTAVILTRTVPVTDGSVTIRLDSIQERTKISAIQVQRV